MSPCQPPQVMLSNSCDCSQIFGSLTSRQLEPFGRQLSPPQPAATMRSLDQAWLQTCFEVIKLARKSDLPRHEWPLQPRHHQPTNSCEFSQTCCLVISEQFSGFAAMQASPPQPCTLRPRVFWAFRQMRRAEMLPAVASRLRQELPPQPRHFKLLKVLFARWQISIEVISEHEASLLRQALPPQPIASKPNFSTAFVQTALSVTSRRVAVVSKHLDPPQPRHFSFNLPISAGSSHMSGSLMSLHFIFRVGLAQSRPVQPRQFMPSFCLALLQM
mmetsp:Transcript_54733/g.127429  ORF Transcript_54733/g.127429 Transcript_54733/m.127429 type:complete len:273 (-) Transcript_54733:123-941(-)